jgi:hypothetical protein
MFPDTVRQLRDRFADGRSRRVVFLSHCLLNENTRYMGGAFCSGIPREVRQLVSELDCGVVQMMCPERVAWGGVYKPYLYQFHGIGRRWSLVHRAFSLCMSLFLFLVNWKMRRVARWTAEEIADYVRNGMEVAAIIGVRGSPACGITAAPNLGEYFDWSARVDVRTVTAEEQNRVLRRVTHPGTGVFMAMLRRQLRRRGIDVPMHEYDLMAEMSGDVNESFRLAEQSVRCAGRTCAEAGRLS